MIVTSVFLPPRQMGDNQNIHFFEKQDEHFPIRNVYTCDSYHEQLRRLAVRLQKERRKKSKQNIRTLLLSLISTC